MAINSFQHFELDIIFRVRHNSPATHNVRRMSCPLFEQK